MGKDISTALPICYTYFLEHVHDYDTDYSRDLAELLPYELEAKGVLKKSETLSKES